MAEKPKKAGLDLYRGVWPQVWALVKPRWKLLSLGFLLMAVNRVAGLVTPYQTKYLIDNVIIKKQAHLLGPLVLIVLAATVVQGITSFALTQLLSKEAQRLIAQLRREVQSHVSRLPVAYFDTNKTGVLVSRIMTDVEGVRNLIGTGLVEFAGGLLTASIAFVVLLKISSVMTIMAFSFVAVFMFVLRIAFKKLRPIFRERGKINAEVTGRLTETLGGIRVVKGYHAEQREEDVFSMGVQRLLDNVLKTLTGTSAMSLSSAVLMGCVGALVMWIGAHQVLRGQLTVGGLFSYTLFLGFLIAPAIQVVAIGTQITEALAGLERTREVLNTIAENADPKRAQSLDVIEGDVRFENVRFEYETDKEVLHGISLHSPPGTVTALVGSSGSGKSTIIGLIAAFHEPTNGTIRVDGKDLSEVELYSYRGQLGVVLQESFLFDGSIRDNIAFSKPDATDEEMMRVCRIARVDEFAERFADKYDTIVGERGVKLSGGQRQRISIARAILADPRILILDEATSSLDSESEQMIQTGLRYLLTGRTTFVIAHRLSTIRQADQILVVEDGQIVERGNHDELYAAHGRYRELYDKQHNLQENLFIAPGEEVAAEKG
jgi:ABC-type multidrug transport system fused ATPase/permease subunit